jgi:hypothetical protein
MLSCFKSISGTRLQNFGWSYYVGLREKRNSTPVGREMGMRLRNFESLFYILFFFLSLLLFLK